MITTIIIAGAAFYVGSGVYQRHIQSKSSQAGDRHSPKTQTGYKTPIFHDKKDINSANSPFVEYVNEISNETASYRYHPSYVTFKKRVQEAIETLNQKKDGLFLGKERSQQINEMSEDGGKPERSEMEKKIDLNFALSLTSLGLTTVGTLVYWPLILTSVPLLAYTSIELLQGGYQSLVKERRVGMGVVDMIALPGIVVSGHILIASIAYSFYYLGRKLSLIIRGHSQENLINMFSKQPQFVWIQQGDIEIEVSFDTLKQGDVIIVHAGGMISADGMVTSGHAQVDQRALTGEAQPVEKASGDPVFASTVLLSGKIYIQVQKAGSETISAQISQMLMQTAEHKTDRQLRGERIADQTALPTLLLSAFTWPLLGIESALAVLQLGFGYTMRVIAPISTLNFLNIASQQGVLIKDGHALEVLHSVDTVIFDKTGTLTLNEPEVSHVYSFDDHTINELLTLAATAEAKQTHPIARAIQKAAAERQLSLLDIEDTSYEIGYGIKVRLENKTILVGSGRFMELEGVPLPDDAHRLQESLIEKGHSLVYITVDQQLSGAIELQPHLRLEAKKVVDTLRQKGMSVVIISGDHEQPTRNLAAKLEVDDYFANTLPEDKAKLVQKMQSQGRRVCFVGDGINDAIALKQADVSISLRGAASVATDAAQIILMNENLAQLTKLFELIDEFEANMQLNFLATMIPGVICLGGVIFLNFGVITACVLFDLGLISGLSNAMRPLLRHR